MQPALSKNRVFRFAPSPNGLMHLGHALSAILNHDLAAACGGRFLLRIEDIDTTRGRPAFEAAIQEDLAWLGLGWETPVRRQSEHMDDYEAALESLRARGLLYRCFRTRGEVAAEIVRAPHGPVEAFRGAPLHENEEARFLEEDRAFAWRLSLDAALAAVDPAALTFIEAGAGEILAHPELAGDVVLARKDIGVAYHLAVVVDDALQGVTDVIRGQDLAEATHIQRLLQALLGLPTPAYHHHRLLLAPDGKRLAKRDRAQTLRGLRAAGMTATALRRELGFD
jgi:glutamyl-Q tRNA(Asp) synthetase